MVWEQLKLWFRNTWSYDSGTHETMVREHMKLWFGNTLKHMKLWFGNTCHRSIIIRVQVGIDKVREYQYNFLLKIERKQLHI